MPNTKSSSKTKSKTSSKTKSKSSSKQDEQKLIRNALLAQSAIATGIALASGKAMYNKVNKIPKKNLSEQEYQEYQQLYKKLPKLSKAKLYGLGNVDCQLDDKDCLRFAELLKKANDSEDYSKNFRWYNPVSWF